MGQVSLSLELIVYPLLVFADVGFELMILCLSLPNAESTGVSHHAYLG